MFLLLLAGLTISLGGRPQFSHFPPVSRRSDQVPPPSPHLMPTGRPGLLSQQDLREEREELLALLAAPGPGSGQAQPGQEGGGGGGRPRQKLGRFLGSREVGRLSRSRTSLARGDKERGRKEDNDQQLPARKLNFQRRLRAGPGRNVNSVDVEEKIEKPSVFRPRPRARSRADDGKKIIANRKKIIKKLKVQEEKKEENEVESGKGLIQRRVRVKPQRKNVDANVDAVKIAARQFQRRLRPRLEENKEESRGEEISSSLNTLARSRAGNKDRDDSSGAATTRYEIEPQVSTLRPGNSASRPTIESLNIDPRRTQQRKWPTSTSKTPLNTQPTEIQPKTSVTEEMLSLMDERFLPTIRNLISKKSRKRFRKIKTNSKSGRRRLKGESNLIIDTAEFRDKQNINRETTSTRLVNLITTTTTLINLITSTGPGSPAFRKNSRARGGVGGRSEQLEETTTINPSLITTTTTTTEPTTTTTTTKITTTTTTSTTTTTAATTTTTREPRRDDVRVASEPNYPVEERTVYNPHKSRVSSRRNEITGTGLSPVTYDLEKALKQAEITWAQDPFRKTSGLPGKPTFDIDFSKNPAAPSRSNPGQNSSSASRRKTSSNLRVVAPPPPQISSPSPSSDPSRKPLELWTPAQLRGLIE